MRGARERSAAEARSWPAPVLTLGLALLPTACRSASPPSAATPALHSAAPAPGPAPGTPQPPATPPDPSAGPEPPRTALVRAAPGNPDGAPPPEFRPPAPPRSSLESVPGHVPRRRGSLPLRAWRSHVRIYSELPLDFERLANVAQWTRDRSLRWLADQPFETEPVEVYLCDRQDELRRLEDELPLPGARPLPRTSKGGYFHSQSTVLLLVEEGRNTEWLLAHEMFHSVFRHVAKANPPALNEGLAEVVPSWILFGGGPTPELARARYPDYEVVLAELVTNGRVPPLRDFVKLDADEFHRNRWASFSLAWSLARLLVESRDPVIRGRVPDLLRALHTDPWTAFCEVYDAEAVERAWRAELRSFAGP